MKSSRSLASAFILLTIVGCGGGGGTVGSSAAGGGQDSSFGPFLTRAAGPTHLATSTNGGLTITAIFGSAFSKITYSPTPILANTRIAFVRSGAVGELYVAPSGDYSQAHLVPGMTAVADTPSWSRDGRIAVDRNPTPSTSQIWVVNADGSNPRNLGTGMQPVWSPDNFHIAFVKSNGTHNQIYTMTASGGSVTQLSDGTSEDTHPSWSGDGLTIFFIRLNVATGHHEVWKMSSTGTSVSQVFAVGGEIDYAAVNPQGNELVYDVNAGSFSELWGIPYPTGGGVAGVFATNANTTFASPAWAPDGSEVVFGEAIANFGNSISMATPGGNNFLSWNGAVPGDYTLGFPAWEPFPVAQPYVSSTGGYIVSNASSGFLYGLNGNGFASFLSFTCTTPTTALITADPVTPGQANLIYRLSGDAITSLKFINGFGAAVNSVTTSNSKQAVVAVNAGTGGIVSILIGLKMAPLVSKSGTVYAGTFTGVYDAHGKNLAPNGASQVVLSPDGAVASVR